MLPQCNPADMMQRTQWFPPPLSHTFADLMQHCTQWCSHNATLLTCCSEHNDSPLLHISADLMQHSTQWCSHNAPLLTWCSEDNNSPLLHISADLMQHCTQWCSHNAPLLTWYSEHNDSPLLHISPALMQHCTQWCSHNAPLLTWYSEHPSLIAYICWLDAALHTVMLPQCNPADMLQRTQWFPPYCTSADLMQHCTQWCSHNATLLTCCSEHNDPPLIAYICWLNAALHTLMLPQCTPADMIQRTQWFPPPLSHISADLMQHCTQWCSHNATLLTCCSEHNDSPLIAHLLT